MVQNQYLHHIAWGPNRKVHTWPMYFVNGFKFHTEDWSVGKKTINCGVCVKADDQGADENYYYGIVKEIVQVEYPGEPTKQIVLFNCEWFDAVINHGVKVQSKYGIVEVHHRRRHAEYDPFICATNAIQVYYVPYPEKIKEKVDWWVVIKTKPRGTVDDRYTLEIAYQDSTTNVDFVTNDELLDHLRDEEGESDEVEMNVVDDVGENDEDEEEEDEFDFENISENDDDLYNQYQSDDDDDDDDDDDHDDD